ncbi:MAG: ABC transporter ATP-binding protein [Tenuifilaceae bacterium]|nr:ABC transporter ATP-binding protein [Tenuifilaceae bacterium]
MSKAITPDNILDVTNLSIAFGSSCVLQNLTFSLKLGESLGIVGESGSGKSITALSLMGLLPPGAKTTSGLVNLTLPNEDTANLVGLNTDKHKQLRGKHLAMIFQEPMTSLNPSMRCGKQVEEAIAVHQQLSVKQLKIRCISLLKEVQIAEAEKAYKSYPFQLSGGQKQRIMIAMALAGNPSVLIADEPTTALDVTVQKEIIGLLNSIVRRRGMSLIFISHDLGVISEVTNRILVLKDGILVEQGETAQIILAPQHPYTKGLMACRPPLNKRPIVLPTVQQYLSGDNMGCIPEQNMDKENQRIYSNQPILNVSGLNVEFITQRNFFGSTTRSFKAVNNLSFNLYPTETLGLVGESGCGKTTLGRAILGLTPYASGNILYREKNIKSFSKTQMAQFRQDVQLVFQDPYSSLNPRLTVGETIMEPIDFYGLAKSKNAKRSKAEELIARVSLPPNSFYRYPHEFSGGQRQRIGIARALAVNPKVLICDEMVSALDVSVQAQMLNLLNQIKKDFGLTYIFISHDLSVVKYMSNRILVMQNGNIIEYGIADQVFNSPTSEYTRKLISAIPGYSS